MFTLRRLFALLALSALALAACGRDDTATNTGTDTGTDTATGAGEWPELVAPTAAGGQLDLGDLEGNDVMLWFWAPW